MSQHVVNSHVPAAEFGSKGCPWWVDMVPLQNMVLNFPMKFMLESNFPEIIRSRTFKD